MTMNLYTSVLQNKKQDDMEKLENVLDAVSLKGDEIAEERYNNEQKEKHKVLEFQTNHAVG